MVVSGKCGQTVVRMGVEEDDPEAEVDRRGDCGDHGGAVPGCSVAGFGAIRRLGKLEELAQKDHVSVAQPRMAHEADRDVLVATTPEHNVPERLAYAQRDAELDLTHSGRSAGGRRRRTARCSGPPPTEC